MIKISNEAHVMKTFKGFRNEAQVVFKLTILGRPKTIENTYYGMCTQRLFDNGEALYDIHKKARNSMPYFNVNLVSIYNEIGEDCFEIVALCRDMPYLSADTIKKGYIASRPECLNMRKMDNSVQTLVKKSQIVRIKNGHSKRDKDRYSSDHNGIRTKSIKFYQDNKEIINQKSKKYYQDNKVVILGKAKARYHADKLIRQSGEIVLDI